MKCLCPSCGQQVTVEKYWYGDDVWSFKSHTNGFGEHCDGSYELIQQNESYSDSDS